MQSGTRVRGCVMGPDAYRSAGLAETLADLEHSVVDLGNVVPDAVSASTAHPNPNLHNLAETVSWITALTEAAYAATKSHALPIFMGGDHALAAGTVPGVARAVAEEGRPLFVLWLDAHPDLHSPDSTTSGNLHGTPVAYFTGQAGFDGVFPALDTPVDPSHVTMLGLRSVDPSERRALQFTGITGHDMRAIDEFGVLPLLSAFLQQVEAADGVIHVSLDVDFLDPGIAPAVGTTVPGGASFREAHLIMEMLHDTGRVRALDLVELNPFLDERGRTARLMVDLAASLCGRTILDRPTRSF